MFARWWSVRILPLPPIDVTEERGRIFHPEATLLEPLRGFFMTHTVIYIFTGYQTRRRDAPLHKTRLGCYTEWLELLRLTNFSEIALRRRWDEDRVEHVMAALILMATGLRVAVETHVGHLRG